MAKRKGDYLIPFDATTGNQLHYAGMWYSEENVVWTPNTTFEDEFEFVRMYRGRSALYFEMKSQRNGKHYTMFGTDVADILKRGIVEDGVIYGVWTFVKRGENYGVKLA